jgi:hypothetical protein
MLPKPYTKVAYKIVRKRQVAPFPWIWSATILLVCSVLYHFEFTTYRN